MADRTHAPKPTSGWWADSARHREAAMKHNSHGGLGRGGRTPIGKVASKVGRRVPSPTPSAAVKHVGIPLQASGRRA